MDTTQEEKEMKEKIESAEVSIAEIFPEELAELRSEQEAAEVEEAPVEEEEVFEAAAEEEAVTQPEFPNVIIEEVEDEDKAEAPVEEEEIELSEENITKLINGEVDKLETVSTEGEVENKFWNEDEAVKKLKETYSYAEIDESDLDEAFRSVAEKAAIENKAYQDSLKADLEKLKAKEAKFAEKEERFKDIERGLHFDQLPDTTSNFVNPMNEAGSQMNRIIATEGLNISVHDLVAAQDRKAFNELTKDVELPDEIHTQLVNHWRNYRDVNYKYRTARNAAVSKMKVSVSSQIPQEALEDVLETALNRKLQSDSKYKYIGDAINEGLEADSPVMTIISKTKGNLAAVFDAISNPTDYARDTDFQENLAKFFLEAAHREQIEAKHYELLEKFESTQADLKRLAKAHLQLKKSSKGLDSSGAPVSLRAAPKSTKAKKKDEAEQVAKLEAIARGDLKFGDL